VNLNMHLSFVLSIVILAVAHAAQVASAPAAGGDLVIADFQPRPNLAYEPRLKAGGDNRQLRIVRDAGCIEAFDPAPARAGAVGFEVSGRFDEGGCPDWPGVGGVWLELKGSQAGACTIEFLRKGGAEHVCGASFDASAEWATVRIPRQRFDAPFTADIDIARINLPAGVDLCIRRAGVTVGNEAYRTEMTARTRRMLDHFIWRDAVLQSRGLTLPVMADALSDLRQALEAGRFDAVDEIRTRIDTAWWFGIELSALRAMNDANLDRATALHDETLLAEARTHAGAIADLFRRAEAAKAVADLPDPAAAYEDEDSLAERTMTAVTAADLRPSVKGRCYYSPSGKPIHLYAVHSFFASREGMYEGGFDLAYRRIAGLGFNGIRFEAQPYQFMPTPDGPDAAVAESYRRSIRTAWKYGLWVHYDNHFYLPGWACQSPEEFAGSQPSGQSNFYQNREAVLRLWSATADALADCKNILLFETPGNEPMFYDMDGSIILRIPSMMHAWNQFLKARYTSRAALAEAWTASVEFPTENALRADEDWDGDTIQPPGIVESGLADPKNQTARLWDWIIFARDLQAATSAAVAGTVQDRIPAATFMQQYIIGDEFNHDPISLSYQSIIQARTDASVFLGSHYGAAGYQVLKAVALGTPSSDSEYPAEDRYGAFLIQKLLNSGLCIFADYGRWGGGMLWENDAADFKPSTRYVPMIADFFTTAEPQFTEPVPQVVVIEPTRLRATMQETCISDVLAIIDRAGVRYHVFEEHYVIEHAEVLGRYKLAVANLTFAHPGLLDALDAAGIPAVLFGSPVRDAYGRVWPEGLVGWFRDHRRFILGQAPASAAQAGDAVGVISLEGSARFHYDDAGLAGTEKWSGGDYDDSAWSTKPVPGTWGELEIMGSRKYFLGDGWYRFHVTIPEAWRSKEIALRIGAIDDTDECFLNGEPIGRTGTDTSNWWIAPRRYVLPERLVRFGEDNVIAIRVTNTLDDAGITRGPVELGTRDTASVQFLADFGFLKRGDALAAVVTADQFLPSQPDLAPTAVVFAQLDDRAAIVSDGPWSLLALAPRIGRAENDERLLLSALRHAGLDVVYPAVPKARVFPFTRGYVLVCGDPDHPTRLTLPGDCKPVGQAVLQDPQPAENGTDYLVPPGAVALLRSMTPGSQ